MNSIRRLAVAAVIVLGCGDALSGQTQPKSFQPPPGKFIDSPEEWEPVGSFDELIKRSDIIVDATVVSISPPVVFDPDRPTGVVTGALISVQNVILGKPSTPRQILMFEEGGKNGAWDLSVFGNPLVQQGERYIFFLTAISRQDPPSAAGLVPSPSVAPRYGAIGFANGKAKVSAAGTIQFNSGAISGIQKYDGNDMNSFIATVKSRISVLFPPLTGTYPKGVKPVPPPPGGLFDPPKRVPIPTERPPSLAAQPRNFFRV